MRPGAPPKTRGMTLETTTGSDFADVELATVVRNDAEFAAVVIGPAEAPIPFAGGGDGAVAAEGTVYFRHGARSVPAAPSDLLRWRDREVARLRKEWLRGIRQVVQAPPGHTVTVVPSGGPAETGPLVRGAISTTGRGTKVVVQNADEIFSSGNYSKVMPVNRIDERSLQPGPLYRKARELYWDYAHA